MSEHNGDATMQATTTDDNLNPRQADVEEEEEAELEPEEEEEWQGLNEMDQVSPNLWIGGLQATKDVEKLRANNIRCVLSAMRGSVKIHEVSHVMSACRLKR